MSAVTTAAKPSLSVASLVERARGWLRPLNLHFAGVGLLVLVNVYLLVHMAFLWQAASSNDEAAVAQQQITLKTAQIAAEPLRGLDAKLARATEDADAFYAKRLPVTTSAVLAELGAQTKLHGVRLIRSQYVYAPALAGAAGELTEMRVDAGLSGDYRPLVQFINALERDKTFFVIDSVTLTGQQSGAVNLRLQLRTYLRGRVPEDEMEKAAAEAKAADAGADKKPGADATPAGGGAGR